MTQEFDDQVGRFFDFLGELDQVLTAQSGCSVTVTAPPESEIDRIIGESSRTGESLLATVLIETTAGQSYLYRAPYPLSNGTLLLNGTLRSPGLRFLQDGQRLGAPTEGRRIVQKEIERLATLFQGGKDWQIKARLNSHLRDGLRYFPLLDRTNPLSEVCSLHEVSYRSEHISSRLRSILQGDFNRLCPFDPSEKGPGERLSLAVGARVEHGKEAKAGSSLLGHAASLVPFLGHTHPRKVAAATKEMRQALPLLHAEPPLVTTGREREIAALSGRIRTAKGDGMVTSVRYEDCAGGMISVMETSGSMRDYPISGCVHVHTETSFRGACFWESPSIRVGQNIKMGDRIAEGCGVRGGELALGVNLLVAYMPWYGYNFEDAVVISDRLQREDVLTSVHVYERKLPRERHSSDREWEGLRAHAGDRSPHLIEGSVVGGRSYQHGLDQALWIREERKVETGDKLTGRHGNKGVVSLVVPEGEMPYFDVQNSDGRKDQRIVDVILNPTSPVSRLSLGQIFECHYGWVIHELRHPDDLRGLANTEPDWIRGSGELSAGSRLDELSRLLQATGLDAYGRASLRRRVGARPEEGLGRYVVGYQYVLKLAHLSRDYMTAVGQNPRRDPVTHQPQDGRRIGEMGVRSLLAHEVPAVLQELCTAGSDDSAGARRLRFDGRIRPCFPGSFKALRTYIRGLGLHLILEGEKGDAFTSKQLASPKFSVEEVKRLRLKLPSSEEVASWEDLTAIELKEKVRHPLFERGSRQFKPGKEVRESGDYVEVDQDGNEVQKTEPRTLEKGAQFPKLRAGRNWRRKREPEFFAEAWLTNLPRIPSTQMRRHPGQQEADLDRLYRDVIQAETPEERYRAIKCLFITGRHFPWRNEKFNSILDLLIGKEGLLNTNFRKMHQNSGEAIIVPDPTLPLNGIGLPFPLVLEILKPFRDQLGITPFWWGAFPGARSSPEKTGMYHLLEIRLRSENVLVLALRTPIHHKYSILAFEPHVRSDLCIGLPPLLCKGFAADFDGDPMRVFLLVSDTSRREARKMLPTSNLLSLATGRSMLGWSQDFRLGGVPATAEARLSDYLTGLGQNPKGQQSALLRLQKRVLDRATRSGVSFSIFDVLDIANIVVGDSSEPEWKRKLDALRSEKNSVATIVCTGARGSIDQVREMAGRIGQFQWLSEDDETREGHIDSNFLVGLSVDDIKCYARFARSLQVRRVRWNSGVHAFVRELVETASDFKLEEKDCGREQRSVLACGTKGGLCRVCYGSDLATGTLADIGYHVGIIAAQSLGEALAQEVLKATHWSPGRGVQSPAFQDPRFVAAVKKLDPGEEDVNVVASVLHDHGLDVDRRHLEVLMRAKRAAGSSGVGNGSPRPKKGWLNLAALHATRRRLPKILREATADGAVDSLDSPLSRIVLGQRYDGRVNGARVARRLKPVNPVFYLFYVDGQLNVVTIPARARVKLDGGMEVLAPALTNLGTTLVTRYTGKTLPVHGRGHGELKENDIPPELHSKREKLLTKCGVVLPDGQLVGLGAFFVSPGLASKRGRPRKTNPEWVRQLTAEMQALDRGKRYPRVRQFLKERKEGHDPSKKEIMAYYKAALAECCGAK